MKYELIRQTLGTYIAGISFAPFPVIPENFPYEPTPGQAWARWSLRPVDAHLADIEAGMERVSALIWFQIFVPEGGGSTPATQIADIIDTNLFQKRITVDTNTIIRTHAGKLNYVGPDATGWVQWRCVVDFLCDVFIP